MPDVQVKLNVPLVSEFPQRFCGCIRTGSRVLLVCHGMPCLLRHQWREVIRFSRHLRRCFLSFCFEMLQRRMTLAGQWQGV